MKIRYFQERVNNGSHFTVPLDLTGFYRNIGK